MDTRKKYIIGGIEGWRLRGKGERKGEGQQYTDVGGKEMERNNCQAEELEWKKGGGICKPPGRMDCERGRNNLQKSGEGVAEEGRIKMKT